jgi:hypothetical protein
MKILKEKLMNNSTKIKSKIENKSFGTVGYTLPEASGLNIPEVDAEIESRRGAVVKFDTLAISDIWKTDYMVENETSLYGSDNTATEHLDTVSDTAIPERDSAEWIWNDISYTDPLHSTSEKEAVGAKSGIAGGIQSNPTSGINTLDGSDDETDEFIKSREDVFERLAKSIEAFSSCEPTSEIFENNLRESRQKLEDFSKCSTMEEANTTFDNIIQLKTEAKDINNKFPLIISYNNVVCCWSDYLDALSYYSQDELLKENVESVSAQLDNLGSSVSQIYTTGGNAEEKMVYIRQQSNAVFKNIEEIQSVNVENEYSKYVTGSIISIQEFYNYADEELDAAEESDKEICINNILKSNEYCTFKPKIDEISNKFTDVCNANRLKEKNTGSMFSSILPDLPALDKNNPICQCHDKLDEVNYSLDEFLAKKNSGSISLDPAENKLKLDTLNSDINHVNATLNDIYDSKLGNIDKNFVKFNTNMDAANAKFNKFLNKLNTQEILHSFDEDFNIINEIQNEISDISIFPPWTELNVSEPEASFKTELLNHKIESMQTKLNSVFENINSSINTTSAELNNAVIFMSKINEHISEICNNMPKPLDPSFVPTINNVQINKLQVLNDLLNGKSREIDNILNLYADNAVADIEKLKSNLNPYIKYSLGSLNEKTNLIDFKLKQFYDSYVDCSQVIPSLDKIQTNFDEFKNTTLPKIYNPAEDLKDKFMGNAKNIKTKTLNHINTNPMVTQALEVQQKLNELRNKEFTNISISPEKQQMLDASSNIISSISSVSIEQNITNVKDNIIEKTMTSQEKINDLKNAENPVNKLKAKAANTMKEPAEDSNNQATDSSSGGSAANLRAVSSTSGMLLCNKGLIPIPYQIAPTGQSFGPGKSIGGVLFPTLIPAFGGCLNSTNPTSAATLGVPPFVCMGGMLHAPFTPGSKCVKLLGVSNALTEKDKAMCLFAAGGEITIKDPGQEKTKYKN